MLYFYPQKLLKTPWDPFVGKCGVFPNKMIPGENACLLGILYCLLTEELNWQKGNILPVENKYAKVSAKKLLEKFLDVIKCKIHNKILLHLFFVFSLPRIILFKFKKTFKKIWGPKQNFPCNSS